MQNIPNTVVETMTDYAIKMCYEGLVKTPADIAKNLVTDLNIFKGVVFDLRSNSINNKVIIDKGFEAGMDYVRDALKGNTNKFIKKQINNASSTPIAVFMPDYKGGGYRQYLILKGLQTYYNKSEVDIQLALPSFGFSLGSKEGGKWKLVGFTPNKFNIDEAFIFGAVKHNGQWQGIRMYIN